MEKRLFNLYLKYIQESCPNVWEQLGKIPSKLKGLLGCMIISYIASIALLAISNYCNELWSMILAGASILLQCTPSQVQF